MKEYEIKNEFAKIWGKINELESKILTQNNSANMEKTNICTDAFKGLQKGVQEMIEDGFFNTPKSVQEAKAELEKKGHFGSDQRIDTVIRRDFFKKKKTLTRVKQGKSWSYVTVK